MIHSDLFSNSAPLWLWLALTILLLYKTQDTCIHISLEWLLFVLISSSSEIFFWTPLNFPSASILPNAFVLLLFISESSSALFLHFRSHQQASLLHFKVPNLFWLSRFLPEEDLDKIQLLVQRMWQVSQSLAWTHLEQVLSCTVGQKTAPMFVHFGKIGIVWRNGKRKNSA